MRSFQICVGSWKKSLTYQSRRLTFKQCNKQLDILECIYQFITKMFSIRSRSDTRDANEGKSIDMRTKWQRWKYNCFYRCEIKSKLLELYFFSDTIFLFAFWKRYHQLSLKATNDFIAYKILQIFVPTVIIFLCFINKRLISSFKFPVNCNIVSKLIVFQVCFVCHILGIFLPSVTMLITENKYFHQMK